VFWVVDEGVRRWRRCGRQWWGDKLSITSPAKAKQLTNIIENIIKHQYQRINKYLSQRQKYCVSKNIIKKIKYY
jgi:hypothetical protein